MLLSILMIVKNEEKYLEQCLQALQPVLEAVPSELIITDTGSTDGTLGIAQRYATTCLTTEWHDNFAAARNHGLRQAKGKWVCFVDADEMLQDPTELIEFFTSSEHKKYKSAGWYIDNVTTGGRILSNFIHRLVRREPDTKFEGAIHEKLVPRKNPDKRLVATSFTHYGYEDQTVTDKNKLERNRTQVTANYEKDPNNMHYILQYMDQLHMERQMDDYLALCREKLVTKKAQTRPADYHILFYKFIIGLSAKKEVDELIDAIESYFEQHSTPVYDTYPILSTYLAKAYEEKNNREKSIYYYQRYYEVATKELERSFLNHATSTMLALPRITQASVDAVMPSLVESYSKAGRFDIAEPMFEKMGIDIQDAYTIYAGENFHRWIEVYQHALTSANQDPTDPKVVAAISTMENLLRPTQRSAFNAKMLLDYPELNTYTRLLKLRLTHTARQSASLLLEELLQDEQANQWYYADALGYGLDYGLDIRPLLDRLASNNQLTDQALTHMIKLLGESLIDIIISYASSTNFLAAELDHHLLWLISELASKILLANQWDDQTNMDLLNIFTIVRESYLRVSAKQEQEWSRMDRFAVAVNQAYAQQDEPLPQALEQAAQTLPQLNFVMQPLIKTLV